MKILHITPATDGYEEVTLLANRINRRNSFAAIVKDDVQYMTGGFLIQDTPRVRAVLDAMSKEEQFAFVKEFKTEPFAKAYLEEEEEKAEPKKVEPEKRTWLAFTEFIKDVLEIKKV